MRLSDPFAIFPRCPDGSLRGGLYRFIPHDELEYKLKRGWALVVLTDKLSCHHDEYSMLCRWVGMTWWQRICLWIECACLPARSRSSFASAEAGGRGMPVPASRSRTEGRPSGIGAGTFSRTDRLYTDWFRKGSVRNELEREENHHCPERR